MRNLNHYYLKLTALSPIHIGTGESYEPTNFVIDDGKLYEFNEVLFYKSLSDVDKRALDNKMSNWLQIIEFYKTKKEEAKQISFFECEVSKEVQKKYDAKKPNQLQINRTFKNPNTHRTIIPGSSIKGMLDTVFHIYSKPEVSSNKERQKLILSDALLVDGHVEIGYSYRKHRVKKEGGKIPQMVEVIQPKSSFILSMKTKYSFKQLQQLMKTYHEDRKNSIYKEDEKSFIARVGKYCGMEYMVDNGKNLKNSYGKPLATYSIYESNTLKDEMFGWIEFELIDENIYQNSLDDIQKQEQEYYQNRDKKQAEALKAINEAEKQIKQKALQKEREEAQEKRKLEEEKAKREAELATMSPLERKIDELKQNNLSNQAVSVIILQALEKGDIQDEDKCEALNIIKEDMLSNKTWKENGNPKKDKAHKRTLKVVEMLKNCN